MFDLKCEVSHLLMYLDQYGASYGDTRSLQGLVDILYRKSLDEENPFDSLSPIVACLIGVTKSNPMAARYLKFSVFGKWAEEKDKNKTNNMMPDGAISEQVVDADPWSLRSMLLPHMTSTNYHLKQIVTEFLWEICSKDSAEFTRLCGFGNAAGLLAEKGFPGFAGMKQNAIDLDELVKHRKQGKKIFDDDDTANKDEPSVEVDLDNLDDKDKTSSKKPPPDSGDQDKRDK